MALVTTFAVRPSQHLDRLDVEVGRLAALADADTAPGSVVAAAHERTIVTTLQLDGSPIEELPADLETATAWQAAADGEPEYGSSGSWYMSFDLLEDAPDERIVALEVQGATSAYASDDLVDQLVQEPLPALSELHRRLTRGLLAPDRAGRPRTTDQAVQDTSVGRVLYFTVRPELVPGELDRLAAWLSGPATELPPVHAAGLLHLEILRIHPFEAANGRLARVAARLWLRRAGLDPHGFAVAEATLAEDPLGYHEEVASTLRRREAGIWLERWGDAVAAGLRRHLREAGSLTGELPDRARSFLAARAGEATFTVADYRAHAAGDEVAADEELGLLLDAGAVARVPGSRGLRFTLNS